MEKPLSRKLVIPKTEHLDQKYWYVNPGIMTKANYEKAFIIINSMDLTRFDLSYVLFLGIKYLVCYLELFSLDQTPLLTESIKNHLKFLLLVTSKQKHSKYLLHHRYICHASNVVEQFIKIPHQDYLERQMYLDHIEIICKMLICKSQLWIKNNDLLSAYMYRYGYSPSKTSVVYCSYIIPNERQYLNPLQHVSQKLLDKIEMKCFCKIKLSFNDLPCHYSDDFVLLEILFDPYRGNFLGFLDMLEYIVKSLSPTAFFPHCLRIIVLEDSCIYNFLTNIPHKKLVRMGKSISLTGRLEPFLEEFSASKRLYSLLEVMIKDEDFDDTVSSVSDNIQDICNICDDSFNEEDEEEMEEKEMENDVKKHNRILKLFSKLYHERIDRIRTKPRYQVSTRDTDIIFNLGNNNSSAIKTDEIVVEELNNSAKRAAPEGHCIEIAMSESESLSDDEFHSDTNFITINVDENCFTQKAYQKNSSNIVEDEVNDGKFRIINDKNNDESSIEVEIDHSFESKFDEIVTKPVCYYSSEAMFNHKLRVMMRCDTAEMSDDIFNPDSPEFMENLQLIHKRNLLEKKYNLEMGIKNVGKIGISLENIVRSDESQLGKMLFNGKEFESLSDTKHSEEKRMTYSKSYSDNRNLGNFDPIQRQGMLNLKTLEDNNADKLLPNKQHAEGRKMTYSKSYSDDRNPIQRQGTLNMNTLERNRTENFGSNKNTLGPYQIISKSSNDHYDKYWLSENAERLLAQRETEDPKTSSLTKENNAGVDSSNWQGLFPQIPQKVYPAMSYQALVDSSSSIKNYVKRFGQDTIRKFVQGKLFNENWMKLLYDQIEFDDIDDNGEFSDCSPKKLLEVFDKFTETELKGNATKNMLKSKGIYSLLKILTKGGLNFSHFKILAEGVGVDIPLLNKINTSPGYLPVWSGYLTDKLGYQPEQSLSFCICQLSYDLLLLKIQHCQVINFIFQYHLNNFRRLISSSPAKVLRVFNVLQILNRLDKVRSEKIYFGDNISDLINDFLGIHELIFSRNCCKFHHQIHGGIKVLYHSINLDNRLHVMEPFIRLPGDRRLKKIEQIGHAVIALRGTHRELLNVDQYTVDIFYDFQKGNHFGTFDMLQAMMSKPSQSSILQGHRSLICFPTGELWIFNDLDWLKVSTTYFLSRDKKLTDLLDN